MGSHLSTPQHSDWTLLLRLGQRRGVLCSICSGESPPEEAGGDERALIQIKSAFAHTVHNRYHRRGFCCHFHVSQVT